MANEAVRTKIVEAAGPIFARKGFQGATIREICEAAEVNLAAVNYHFRTKRLLYFASIDLAHQLVESKGPFPTWSAGEPAVDRLRGFIVTLVKRILSTTWETRLLLREQLVPTEARGELVESLIQRAMRVLLPILDDLLPPGTSEPKRLWLGYSISSLCSFPRIATTHTDVSETPSAEEIAEYIAEFSLGAINRLEAER